MKTITFAITVKDELEEIKKLLNVLNSSIKQTDEIVILFDNKNGDPRVLDYIKSFQSSKFLRYFQEPFDNNFANWKNKLTGFCSKDYIFQIDADEIPNELLLENLHSILEENDIDVYLVPRINTVEGITDSHISKWGWRKNEKGWINFPDYQWRLYKNNIEIKWKNKVHEVLVGFKTYSVLPAYEELSLYHPKNIQRQERQNSFYDSL